ncbi:TetR/AcrR family transcriptional regulator [Desulforhabdus sp. TSK]|uniref:TetR/AcrR family transcriptional regulator n=1 Tax=Desulforhabdus sp. TSK TaxID=2925014 RepID=UPI001FC8409A|nr:TetR/AcrR family transcriptional regulator [Desulforhabdus sp. TSK]GKT07898.1 TetR family transcriptional regulator [Desulforhabdus sp. TSK]
MAPRSTFIKLEDEKQQRILDTAVDEFADHGFKQASVNRIVQKLGIAKGSIFQYFGTKEGLFNFIFNHAVELVRQSLRQVKQETAEADFFERIEESVMAGVRFIRKHPKIYRIYLKMIFQEDFPLRTEFLQQVHLFSAEYLKPLVERGVARGELRPELNVDLAVFFLDALMDRFLQAHCVSFLDAGAGLYQAPEEVLEAKVLALIEILQQGMGAHGQRPSFYT